MAKWKNENGKDSQAREIDNKCMIQGIQTGREKNCGENIIFARDFGTKTVTKR
jgi:hypothetical protein